MTRNTDVRQAIKGNAVLMWQIAEGLGMADSSLSRKMRQELPPETKQRIYEIIDRIVKEREEEMACS